jgi:hypothetical protein
MTETAQLSVTTECCWNFGGSAAIDETGQVIAVGAAQGIGKQDESGVAEGYVEPQRGWQTTSKSNLRLLASDGRQGDEFGWAASLSGNTLVVGAPGVANAQGAAYVFGQQ